MNCQPGSSDAASVFSIIKNLIPKSCVFCGDRQENEQVCEQCIRVLPWNESFCEHCGQPVGSKLPPGITCAACQQRLPAYSKARSPFHYRFPVDSALKAMKFRGQLMYAPALASLLQAILDADFAECDALVAVPLHRWRHVTRGFNQSAELCNELAAYSGLPILDSAIRTRATRTQSGLSSAMRKTNLNGAFDVRGKLHVRYPLIVDDVITTGATCEHLALTLLKAGAERVGVLTVARSSTLTN